MNSIEPVHHTPVKLYKSGSNSGRKTPDNAAEKI
jgi:hypothetical protein